MIPTTRPAIRRALAAIGLAVTATVSFGGCGFDLTSVRLPHIVGAHATYPLHIQFANVLNLPDGAPVIANGVTIGHLIGLHLDDNGNNGYVTADIVIDNTVQLPDTVTATLQQAAPLSDVHIVVSIPRQQSTATLSPGGTIPLAHSSEAPQIEDTMASLATAIGNGTITNFENTVHQIDSVLPNDPAETAKIFGTVGKDLTDIAGQQQSLTSVLDGLRATTGEVNSDQSMISPMLTPAGVQHTTEAMSSVLGIIFILTDLGPLAGPTLWLAPLVNSLDKAAKAVVPILFSGNPLDTRVPSNLNRLVDLIQNELIPFLATGPKVDVTGLRVDGSTVALSAGQQTQQIVQTLRMIGAVR